MSIPPITVTITGAAGQISYSLLPFICQGHMFGPHQPVRLRLLEIPPALTALRGVVMELQDSRFSLLVPNPDPVLEASSDPAVTSTDPAIASSPLSPQEYESGIVMTADPELAFRGCQIALLVGAFPRGPGMERKELLQKNAHIFKGIAGALERGAHKDVKVLVVGNPANTNAYIVSHFAKSIPKENISALTRLDLNRTAGLLADTLGIHHTRVKNIAMWGNHSATQYPDVTNVQIAPEQVYPSTTSLIDSDDSDSPSSHSSSVPNGMKSAAALKLEEEKLAILNPAYLADVFIPTIQKRGAKVIEARKLSSAMSAAKAICDHIRSWVPPSSLHPPQLLQAYADAINNPTFFEQQLEKQKALFPISMGVYLEKGAYGLGADVFYSYPLTIDDKGKWHVVQDWKIDDFSRTYMQASYDELLTEKCDALAIFEESD